MNIKRALLILGVTLFASAQVQAALNIDTYTSRAAWEAAVTGEVVENFDFEALGDFVVRDFPDFTVINENPTDLDTAIQPGTNPTNINGTRFLDFLAQCDTTPTDGMIVDLDRPTQALGFDWHNTDPSGDIAAMEIIVDGQTFAFGAPGSGFFGVVVTNAGGFSTVRFRDTAGGGCALTSLGLDNFTFSDAEVALFNVTKEFEPTSTQTVDVTLTCDGGHELVQTATIAGGDPEGVTFVLQNGVGADCVVTESGSPGYATTMIPAGCTFNNINNVNYSCEIKNVALPVEFGFTKEWVQDGTGGIDLVRESELEIHCDEKILNSTGGYGVCDSNGGPPPHTDYCRQWTSKSDGASSQYFYVDVNATNGAPACEVSEEALDSAIEVTMSGACDTTIPIGSSRTSCVITNTVFFEGIPTLSQYGLAIMALLMLGVGFVGFRRFV